MLTLSGNFPPSSPMSNEPGFNNPFRTIAGMSLPTDYRTVMDLCEFVFTHFNTYRMAMERVASYFITEVDFSADGEQTTDKWHEHFEERGLLVDLRACLMDRFCYGTGYASIVVPFIRFLSCPCGQSKRTLRQVAEDPEADFRFQIPNFIARCPVCKKTQVHDVHDLPADVERKLTIKHWDPKQIEPLHCVATERTQYYWRIPEDYKQQIRSGSIFHLEQANKEVIKAIAGNLTFRFEDDALFVMKEQNLGGQRMRGVGQPRLLADFNQVYMLAVLRKAAEAIATDYVTPWRIFSPPPARGGAEGQATGELLQNIDGSNFVGFVRRMIRDRRRDPASVFVSPYPISYQMAGAEAKQIIPIELIEHITERLLNDAGTPIELFNGSLQIQAAPPALRLFESTWAPLITDANRFLAWYVRSAAQVLNWEVVKCKLKRVTIADDIEKQMLATNLMLGQQISAGRVLGDLGYNWKTEQRRLADEARFQGELQSKLQDEMTQAGIGKQIAQGMGPGGGPAPGGAPPAGGQAQGQPPPGGVDPATGLPAGGPVDQFMAQGSAIPKTPQEMQAAADGMARDLMGQPESSKDSQLRRLKQVNPTMHSLVRAKIDEIRQQARQQGGQQVLQQQGMAA